MRETTPGARRIDRRSLGRRGRNRWRLRRNHGRRRHDGRRFCSHRRPHVRGGLRCRRRRREHHDRRLARSRQRLGRDRRCRRRGRSACRHSRGRARRLETRWRRRRCVGRGKRRAYAHFGRRGLHLCWSGDTRRRGAEASRGGRRAFRPVRPRCRNFGQQIRRAANRRRSCRRPRPARRRRVQFMSHLARGRCRTQVRCRIDERRSRQARLERQRHRWRGIDWRLSGGFDGDGGNRRFDGRAANRRPIRREECRRLAGEEIGERNASHWRRSRRGHPRRHRRGGRGGTRHRSRRWRRRRGVRRGGGHQRPGVHGLERKLIVPDELDGCLRSKGRWSRGGFPSGGTRSLERRRPLLGDSRRRNVLDAQHRYCQRTLRDRGRAR